METILNLGALALMLSLSALALSMAIDVMHGINEDDDDES